MAAYRRVYYSRHLQDDCQKTGISSGTLRSTVEYGLPLPFNVMAFGGGRRPGDNCPGLGVNARHSRAEDGGASIWAKTLLGGPSLRLYAAVPSRRSVILQSVRQTWRGLVRHAGGPGPDACAHARKSINRVKFVKLIPAATTTTAARSGKLQQQQQQQQQWTIDRSSCVVWLYVGPATIRLHGPR